MRELGSSLTTNAYLIFHALPILNDAHYNLIDEFPEGLLDESPGLLHAPILKFRGTKEFGIHKIIA